MKRIEYLPWTTGVLQQCLHLHDSDSLGALDLDLTARCTMAACIYCDSKPAVGSEHPGELGAKETAYLLESASKLGLKWLYSCGLGEPFEDERFTVLIEKALSLGIRVSLFTNALAINARKADWLKRKGVCLIVKLDSLNETTFDRILGRHGAARYIYKAVENLRNAGYGHDRTYATDLAFSIVPTKLNLPDIPDVIRYAIDCNAFPSVGELEQAGMVLAKKHFNDLALDVSHLAGLKADVERLLWEGYKRPICPSIIAGVHIDNVGNCVVDRETGLNCKWFLLKEPRVKVIGNIRDDTMSELVRKARAYRKSCFAKNKRQLTKFRSVDYVFGGCGGSPAEIIPLAQKHL
ncbi:MAG: radical SAM protein [Kiritimatiellae bacterium]|nr:radical SAM protein [Kiritimatiellia bacterium]MDD5520320.1 radical SAM protein [Kiritimatiellia bacterium]